MSNPRQMMSLLRSASRPVMQQTRRSFGAGGHGVEYAGLTISQPLPWQKYGAHFFGGLMWFWVLYRLKNDYKVVLGIEHPWDAHHEEKH